MGEHRYGRSCGCNTGDAQRAAAERWTPPEHPEPESQVRWHCGLLGCRELVDDPGLLPIAARVPPRLGPQRTTGPMALRTLMLNRRPRESCLLPGVTCPGHATQCGRRSTSHHPTAPTPCIASEALAAGWPQSGGAELRRKNWGSRAASVRYPRTDTSSSSPIRVQATDCGGIRTMAPSPGSSARGKPPPRLSPRASPRCRSTSKMPWVRKAPGIAGAGRRIEDTT